MKTTSISASLQKLDQFARYREMIKRQIILLFNDGWDETAVSSYIEYLNGCSNVTVKELNEMSHQLNFIGSPIYKEMFTASQLASKKKVLLVIDQLGGFLDEKGDLHFFKTKFMLYPHMPPNAPFLAIYAKEVQKAYPEGLSVASIDKKLTKTSLKKKYANETKIHQFRHQLDKHNITYIENYRKKHNLKNDEQALKEILHGQWFYADPQFHNRACLSIDITECDRQKQIRTLTNRGLIKKIRKRGFYRKILSQNYHSEFIIDEKGNVVSQWKQGSMSEEYRELVIANGESFNYGKRPREDNMHTHDKLDGLPPRYFDTQERNEIKKHWIAPTDNWFYQLIRRMAEKGIRYKRR